MILQILVDKVEPFEDFGKWFCPAEMKQDLYKTSLILALEVCMILTDKYVEES